MTPSVVPARFVERPNRFLVVAELDDGRRVEAYLPNTGRLGHLTVPGRPLILRRETAGHRKTEYTAIRAWDGTWVALEAGLAPRLLVDWLAAGHPLGPFGAVATIETEVTVAHHRLDLRVGTALGPVWVEVKSGGRALGGAALLSKTPSQRGVSHLRTLADLVTSGERATVAFVVQRGDVERLLVGGDADRAWVQAVRDAHAAGVAVVSYGCAVTETSVRIDRELAVVWESPAARSDPLDADLRRLHRHPDP